MKVAIAAAGAALMLVAAQACAHRLDEYLQQTTLAVEKGRVRAQMLLVPGVAVFGAVLASMDADGDGGLSEAEQRAYAQRVLRDLTLRVDGRRLALRLVSSSFDGIELLREGRGAIQLEFDADVPGRARTRRLTFENRHHGSIAAYLVNALVPRERDMRITAQDRSFDQSFYTLDYIQGGNAMFNGKLEDALNVHDMRELAKKRLPKWMFEFVDRGTEDEVALRNNRAAFERIKLKTRVLTDVSKRSQEIELFGRKHGMPLGIAPTGPAGMLWFQGELELARAAKAANIPFTLATGSQTSMEDVARLVGGTLWFQLYMWSDVRMSHILVERAKNAGFEALVVTVDGPVGTNREYNVRNGYTVPFRYTSRNTIPVLTHPGWLFGVIMKYWMNGGMPTRANYPEGMTEKFTHVSTAERKTKNDSLAWKDLRILRDMWPGKLIVKGILTPQDAELAIANGADGILVSNHGGRNFDSSMAPIEVLPGIVDAVGHKTTVIVDSGFRRGSDVVKALAIGAKLVMVGRATLWGTTVGGEAGAARTINFYREEISRTMAYLGCTRIDQLNRDFLERVPTPHVPLTV